MLQYSVQTAFSSSIDNSDYFPRNDRLNQKWSPKEPFVSRAAFPGPPPPISTNLSSSPTLSALSTASSKLPRSPYISSRQASSPVDLPSARRQSSSQSRPASIASAIDDVLFPGDVVGEGQSLQNENIRLVSIATDKPPLPEHEEPAGEFEVIRRLGAGSYAVVYLVCEVLYRAAPSFDGHITVGDMDDRPRLNNVYGREYAIKCLSKANLDQDAIAAQMSEVTIHQSLRSHPNIVTHHRTYETSSFLLLLLEYVPGEDLFYFLEQARDHYDIDSNSTESSSSNSSARTPPTPSLLSNLNPSQLLSRTRLRLISSMFSQMCDAVADCHDQNVFHRDIKPENFIVTDAWLTDDEGRRERKVVVKLTDFGLSTTDVESSDMDCGSAPYMSYECRNNIAPTYRPRAADVWSLGIVLINMLYHYNPWTDTAVDSCSSFDLFQQSPVNFFMTRFAGMTRPVAELLAGGVFNILDDPSDDSPRITASQFGAWAKDLPDLLGDQPGSAHFGHKRVVSISSTGHPIASSVPVSHRPSSRQASTAIQPRPPHSRADSRTHSRAPSLGPAFERPEALELSTVFDQGVEEEQDAEEQEPEIVLEGMTSRSTSTNKRRKRGARKGKGLSATTPTTPKDETLDTLATASQSLAREISRASKASSKKSNASTTESARARRGAQHFEPVSMYAVPTAMFTNSGVGTTPPLPPLPPAARSAPVTKKPSKWKLSFGKASAANVAAGIKEQTPPAKVDVGTATVSQPSGGQPMSATASNVTTLIMGLSPPPATPVQPSTSNDAISSTWGRGRRPIGSFATGRTIPSPNASVEKFEKVFGHARGTSPHSTRSGRPLASSASSMASSNWRNSTSSAGTSSSAFTHYSNASLKSVSSAATSVSAGSWRSKQAGPQPHSPNSPSAYRPPGIPKNIKIMDGVPWELSQLPRGQHPDPVGDIFGQPPPRKPRARKPQDLKLDTITELGSGSAKKSPTAPRLDASTSTTDLDAVDGDWQNKKVQKGQINALAKMLSALRPVRPDSHR